MRGQNTVYKTCVRAPLCRQTRDTHAYTRAIQTGGAIKFEISLTRPWSVDVEIRVSRVKLIVIRVIATIHRGTHETV